MTAQGTRGASRSRVRSLWFGVAAAIIVSAGLTALSRTGSASEGGDLPVVSPDRLDDAPLGAGDISSVVQVERETSDFLPYATRRTAGMASSAPAAKKHRAQAAEPASANLTSAGAASALSANDTPTRIGGWMM